MGERILPLRRSEILLLFLLLLVCVLLILRILLILLLIVLIVLIVLLLFLFALVVLVIHFETAFRLFCRSSATDILRRKAWKIRKNS